MTPVIGILTLVIAWIALHIANQQAQTSKAQYRLNLYEKRYAVFEATRCFLLDIAKNAKIMDTSGETFWLSIVEAEFLFGGDVVTFLKELRKKAIELVQNQFLQKTLPDKDGRTQAGGEVPVLLKWFIARSDELTELFSPYLKCNT